LCQRFKIFKTLFGILEVLFLVTAFLTGFFIGLSLIVAIGAQNSFVLRQGILKQHVFYIALFCALSDAILIGIGISGISFLFNNFTTQILNYLLGFSALWLIGYGSLKFKAAYNGDSLIDIKESSPKNLLPTLSILAVFTFANPHVYLDTMILIGSVSQQFNDADKIIFGLGASLASFVFFFSLSYGARLLRPLMRQPYSWRILDSLIGLIMLTIAIKLAFTGHWI
jgi:L-lysine exporter family protein LysE/ArgO